jgi:hypothetical protein
LARAHLGDSETARDMIAEAENDPGYDPHAFFGWSRDIGERARAAVTESARRGGKLARIT